MIVKSCFLVGQKLQKNVILNISLDNLTQLFDGWPNSDNSFFDRQLSVDLGLTVGAFIHMIQRPGSK